MAKHPENPSAVALAKFRERAGLTMDKLAKEAGYKTASGVQRYLSPVDRTSPYIDMCVVEGLAKALVGRGNPPITEIEVFSQLAGGLPPRLAGPAEIPTVRVTSSKAIPLPEGSKGLGLYDGKGLAVRLELSRQIIRDIREDLDFLESVLPGE